jgi:DNA-binding sugar fermentation-stimulating protein
MQICNLQKAVIIKRPSKIIKSPYVADISIADQEYLGHTPSLGCCGLADAGQSVLVVELAYKKTDKPHCKYRVCFAVYKERNVQLIIGIYPKLAEDLVEKALQANLLSKLINCKQYKRETKVFVLDKVDSRFDFSGIDAEEKNFYMEVKNVPLADYEDMFAKDRKKANFQGREFDSKVAYFPDGYRKKAKDTISPRALKHIQELTYLKQNTEARCLLCFVIQRNDVNRFTPSIIDPQYRQAVQEALNAGVEIITLVVEWNDCGQAKFIKDDLPIVFENYSTKL